MTRDTIEINDFIVLVELANSDVELRDVCHFEEPLVAIAFYGAGDVALNVRYQDQVRSFQHTKGLALAFYADDQVEFEHVVAPDKPLECIVVATAVRNLQNFPAEEGELFAELLSQLINPKDHYVQGPDFLMTPEMQMLLDQIFHNKLQGKARMVFFRSHITALFAQFLGQLSIQNETQMPAEERKRLQMAREVLVQDLENPPSLTELSRQIGLNVFKLKKGFKELFGVPVFKYLQNERLTKAHELIHEQGLGIQEAAWHVGYDSLSSFSNAFAKKFGYRPSEVK